MGSVPLLEGGLYTLNICGSLNIEKELATEDIAEDVGFSVSGLEPGSFMVWIEEEKARECGPGCRKHTAT